MLPLIALLTVTAYLLAAREQRGGRLAVAGAGAAILLLVTVALNFFARDAVRQNP